MTQPVSPPSPRKPRRMVREPGPVAPSTVPDKHPTKLDEVEALLLAPQGASIAELMTATGWQQHSVRGVMAGALRKRGLIIVSAKVDGQRRYHASRAG